MVRQSSLLSGPFLRTMCLPLVLSMCSAVFGQGVTGLPRTFRGGELGATGASVNPGVLPAAPGTSPSPEATELAVHQETRETALQRMESILKTNPKYTGFRTATETVAAKMPAGPVAAPQTQQLKDLISASQKIVDLGRRINGQLAAPDIAAIMNEFDVALAAVQQLKGADADLLASDLMIALVPGFAGKVGLAAAAPQLLKTLLSRLRVFEVITQATPNSVTPDARTFNSEAQTRQLYSRLQTLTQ